MRNPPRELVESVIASLKCGAGWKFDDFEAKHEPSGVVIWTANDTFAIEISVPKHDGTNRGPYYLRYGGCGNLVFKPRWRRRVYKAALEARSRSSYCKEKYEPVARAICKLNGIA